jgi:hypothetical protein
MQVHAAAKHGASHDRTTTASASRSTGHVDHAQPFGYKQIDGPGRPRTTPEDGADLIGRPPLVIQRPAPGCPRTPRPGVAPPVDFDDFVGNHEQARPEDTGYKQISASVPPWPSKG